MNKAQFLSALLVAFGLTTAATDDENIELINKVLAAPVPAGITETDHEKPFRKAFRDAGFVAPAGADLVQHFAKTLASFVTTVPIVRKYASAHNAPAEERGLLVVTGISLQKDAAGKEIVTTTKGVKQVVVSGTYTPNGSKIGEQVELFTNVNNLKTSGAFRGCKWNDATGLPEVPANDTLVIGVVYSVTEKGVTTWKSSDVADVTAAAGTAGAVETQNTSNGIVKRALIFHTSSNRVFTRFTAGVDQQTVKVLEEARATKAQLAGQTVYETKSAENKADGEGKTRSRKEVLDYANELLAASPELGFAKAMELSISFYKS